VKYVQTFVVRGGSGDWLDRQGDLHDRQGPDRRYIRVRRDHRLPRPVAAVISRSY